MFGYLCCYTSELTGKKGYNASLLYDHHIGKDLLIQVRDEIRAVGLQ